MKARVMSVVWTVKSMMTWARRSPSSGIKLKNPRNRDCPADTPTCCAFSGGLTWHVISVPGGSDSSPSSSTCNMSFVFIRSASSRRPRTKIWLFRQTCQVVLASSWSPGIKILPHRTSVLSYVVLFDKKTQDTKSINNFHIEKFARCSNNFLVDAQWYAVHFSRSSFLPLNGSTNGSSKLRLELARASWQHFSCFQAVPLWRQKEGATYTPMLWRSGKLMTAPAMLEWTRWCSAVKMHGTAQFTITKDVILERLGSCSTCWIFCEMLQFATKGELPIHAPLIGPSQKMGPDKRFQTCKFVVHRRREAEGSQSNLRLIKVQFASFKVLPAPTNHCEAESPSLLEVPSCTTSSQTAR